MMRKPLTIALLALLPFAANAEKRDRPLSEMVQSVRAKAAKLDANSDGVLSGSETSKGREKLGFLAEAVSNTVDLNRDGVLTVKEYGDAQIRELSLADKDHDGILTVSEQKAQQRALLARLFSH